jgi:hypothetical protein
MPASELVSERSRAKPKVAGPVFTRPPIIRPKWVKVTYGRPSRRNNVRGNQFQDRVLRHLEEDYGDALLTDVAFEFDALSGSGRLYPDAILRLPNKLIVIEIKLRSNVYLWYQLANLYAPLARHAWPDMPVCELGIVETLVLPISGVPSQPYLAEKPHRATPAGYWICEHRA